MCLVNFSTATGISFPKRKTELREQFSHLSNRQESSELFVSYGTRLSRGAQEQGGPPWTQQTVITCFGLPRCKIPAQSLGGLTLLWVKGSSMCSALNLPNSPARREVRRGRGYQLQDPAVLALHTFSFIIHHL